MPHFDEFGGDTWICQAPGHQGNRVQSSRVPSAWRTDITGHESAGNVCSSCIAKHDNAPLSLYEHCRRESGLTGAALDRYVNRYYGHN